ASARAQSITLSPTADCVPCSSEKGASYQYVPLRISCFAARAATEAMRRNHCPSKRMTTKAKRYERRVAADAALRGGVLRELPAWAGRSNDDTRVSLSAEPGSEVRGRLVGAVSRPRRQAQQ